MSLHSGFATLQQETFYDSLIEKAISILIQKLVEILPPSDHDMKFYKHMRKIYKYVQQLDNQKQSGTKISQSLEPLYRFIKEKVESNSDALSTLTSQLSVIKGAPANAKKVAQLNSLLGVVDKQNSEGANTDVHRDIVHEQNESFGSQSSPEQTATKNITRNAQINKSPRGVGRQRGPGKLNASQDIKSGVNSIIDTANQLSNKRTNLVTQPQNQGERSSSDTSPIHGLKQMQITATVRPGGGTSGPRRDRNHKFAQHSTSPSTKGRLYNHQIPESNEEYVVAASDFNSRTRLNNEQFAETAAPVLHHPIDGHVKSEHFGILSTDGNVTNKVENQLQQIEQQWVAKPPDSAGDHNPRQPERDTAGFQSAILHHVNYDNGTPEPGHTESLSNQTQPRTAVLAGNQKYERQKPQKQGKRRFASQPRAGFGQQLPKINKKKKKGGYRVLPELPQTKRKVQTGWTSQNLTFGKMQDIQDEFNRLQAIPKLRTRLMRPGRERASSALSGMSKKSNRSLSASSQRSFKMPRKKFSGAGTQLTSSSRNSTAKMKKSKGSLNHRQQAAVYGPMSQNGPGGSLAGRQSKYIKNVMNIPNYMREQKENQNHFVIQNSVVSVNMNHDSLLGAESASFQVPQYLNDTAEEPDAVLGRNYQNSTQRQSSSRYENSNTDLPTDSAFDNMQLDPQVQAELQRMNNMTSELITTSHHKKYDELAQTKIKRAKQAKPLGAFNLGICSSGSRTALGKLNVTKKRYQNGQIQI